MSNYIRAMEEDFGNETEVVRTKQPIYVCEKCNSSDVEEKYWCKTNTFDVIAVVEESEVWCCKM